MLTEKVALQAAVEEACVRKLEAREKQQQAIEERAQAAAMLAYADVC
jgi:hypothetical protein